MHVTDSTLRGKPAAPVAQAGVDAATAQRRIRDMHAAIDQLMAGQDKLF
jgi:hypothetical protein